MLDSLLACADTFCRGLERSQSVVRGGDERQRVRMPYLEIYTECRKTPLTKRSNGRQWRVQQSRVLSVLNRLNALPSAAIALATHILVCYDSCRYLFRCQSQQFILNESSVHNVQVRVN